MMTVDEVFAAASKLSASDQRRLIEALRMMEPSEASHTGDYESSPADAERIVSTPEVMGGKPRIAGHRISVQDVAIWHERLGMGVDEIAHEYQLSLADVHAALSYYYAHREDIAASIQAEATRVAELQHHRSSKLRAKLSG
jgi:uncharacterized protein (DUF433 family)